MLSSDMLPVQGMFSLPAEDYAVFQNEFEALTGIRLVLYKENQMKRRIDTFIARKKMAGYAEFIALLRADPDELAAFVGYITINVTEFFRTPDHWEFLEQSALAELAAQTDRPLKIWSCACSTGEEPYSLAMSLCRLTEPERFHILATDLDESVLRKASIGEYSEKNTEQLSEELRERYFVRNGAHRCVADTLRSCVEFRKLDLLRDEYPSDCDLIVCRNVLIYFTEEAKNNIYTRIRNSLKQGGYLFTGNTEQIIYYKSFGLRKITGYLYQKI